MMQFPAGASNQKFVPFGLEISQVRSTQMNPLLQKGWLRSMSIVCGAAAGFAISLVGQEEPLTPEEHEREELGLNVYTAPSIERIFQQLDALRPLPFEQLQREFPKVSPATRERKGLIFGGLVADGFLVVEAERKSAVDDLGRVLLREARGLGAVDRVTRHSTSLTDLARRGEWLAVQRELIATQADVEQAMTQLHDQKMAHLISPGGWLRGLEISAAAIELDFSPQRATVSGATGLGRLFRRRIEDSATSARPHPAL
jgi:hypothetical protein